MTESTLTRPRASDPRRIESARAANRTDAVPVVDAALFRGLMSAGLIYAVAFGLFFVLR